MWLVTAENGINEQPGDRLTSVNDCYRHCHYVTNQLDLFRYGSLFCLSTSGKRTTSRPNLIFLRCKVAAANARFRETSLLLICCSPRQGASGLQSQIEFLQRLIFASRSGATKLVANFAAFVVPFFFFFVVAKTSRSVKLRITVVQTSFRLHPEIRSFEATNICRRKFGV